MLNSSILLIIIGMGIVTYIPRMIPLVFFSEIKLPDFLQNVLKNVPYAALGTLIIPGVFFMNDDIWFGIIGALTAVIAAYFGANVIIVVMSAIGVLAIYGFLF